MTEEELLIENTELKIKNEWLEKENSRLESEINWLQKEIDSLKSIPPKEELEIKKDQEEEERAYLKKKLETRLVDFNISVRSLNVLRNMGCNTLGDLIKHSPAEILSARNCGKKTIEEIIDVVRHEGFELGMDVDKLFKKGK
jgi:DNA-directed RNA polymerase alpha subunit